LILSISSRVPDAISLENGVGVLKIIPGKGDPENGARGRVGMVVSTTMNATLKFPPHLRGPRDDCPTCQKIIADNPHLKNPSDVFGLCDHPGENYHALVSATDGVNTEITYVCKEEECSGRA
jgi:hypothetical protein